MLYCVTLCQNLNCVPYFGCENALTNDFEPSSMYPTFLESLGNEEYPQAIWEPLTSFWASFTSLENAPLHTLFLNVSLQRTSQPID